MQERLKILEMLRDGIINIDEAEDLLKVMDDSKVEVIENDKVKVITAKENIIKNNTMKMFKIKVLSKDGDKVNVNIPISFLKAAIATGNISNIYSKSININGVDSNLIKDNLDLDLLIECIENDFVGDLVDITSAEGDTVKIYFE